MMEGLTIEQKEKLLIEKGYINVDSMIEYLAEQYATMDSFMVTNDLTEDYLSYVRNMPKNFGSIKFDYGLDVTNNIYTDYTVNSEIKENVSLSGIRARYSSIMKKTQFSEIRLKARFMLNRLLFRFHFPEWNGRYSKRKKEDLFLFRRQNFPRLTWRTKN
jgi:hypothetical protein